jgi:hypothetical protein
MCATAAVISARPSRKRPATAASRYRTLGSRSCSATVAKPRASIAHFERTPVRAQLARVHLLYGGWLRHERLRADARQQLPTACDMLDAMGVQAFGERARRERLATGEIARKRTVETTSELTSQEVHIARLARDGLSNPEIGSRLFISAQRDRRTLCRHPGPATSSALRSCGRAGRRETRSPPAGDRRARRVSARGVPPRPCTYRTRR